jgi:hypothetical protein
MSEFRRIDSAALFTRTVNSSTVLTGVSYTICFKHLVHYERALRHVSTTYPFELATARHPKGHSSHFVKNLNILHHLNVEVRHVARSNDSKLYLPTR